MKAQNTVLAEMLVIPWWVQLLRGVLAILFGAYAILNPALTLMLIVLFLASFLFIEGLFMGYWAFMGKTGNTKRSFFFLKAFFYSAGGLAVLLHPLVATFVTSAMLSWFIGFTSLTCGIIELSSGIRPQKGSGNDWGMIVNGLLYALAGVFFLTIPATFGFSLGITAGICSIFMGVICISNALKFRKGQLNFATS